MEMTNGEIIRSYKEAADKRAQIGILADLNCTKRPNIVKILMDNRCELPKDKGAIYSLTDNGNIFRVPVEDYNRAIGAGENPDEPETIEPETKPEAPYGVAEIPYDPEGTVFHSSFFTADESQVIVLLLDGEIGKLRKNIAELEEQKTRLISDIENLNSNIDRLYAVKGKVLAQ